jgi:LysE type translocator
MLTFAIAALLLIMLPGPDQALITRNALVGGRYGGMLTMFGGVLGLTVHAAAAALGLSALLLASAKAFTILKIVAAVYLLWLAVQMLRSARRRRRSPAIFGGNCQPLSYQPLRYDSTASTRRLPSTRNTTESAHAAATGSRTQDSNCSRACPQANLNDGPESA